MVWSFPLGPGAGTPTNIATYAGIGGDRGKRSISVVETDGTIWLVFMLPTIGDVTYYNPILGGSLTGFIYLYKSTDNGASFSAWSGSGAINTPPSLTRNHNEPTLCLDRDGNIHIIYSLICNADDPDQATLKTNITYRKWIKETNTLTAETVLLSVGDYPALPSLGNNFGKFIICDCDNILRIYYKEKAGVNHQIWTFSSSDSGVTWSTETLIYETTISIIVFSSVAVDQNGNILLAMALQGGGLGSTEPHIVFLKSTNGTTYSAVELRITGIVNRDSRPLLGVDSLNNYYMIAMVDSVIGGLSAIRLWQFKSTDEGVTWISTVLLADADSYSGANYLTHIFYVDSNDRLDVIFAFYITSICIDPVFAPADRLAHPQIRHISSVNRGSTWSTPTILVGAVETLLNNPLTIYVIPGGQRTWHKQGYESHWFYSYTQTTSHCAVTQTKGQTLFEDLAVSSLVMNNIACAIGKSICGPVNSGCPRTASDIEWTDAPRGPMQRDRTAPNSRYRIYLSGGTINIEGA